MACSGGSDSVALLLLLWAHFPSADITVLHFNHKLRPEAEEEAQYVASLSEVLGCKYVIGENEKLEVGFSEESLREVRMDFFKVTLQSINSDTLITGHQQDDVLETQIMRLSRGSGTGGLCAPRPVHSHASGVNYVRPLLTVSKQVIQAGLKELGVYWCEDASNKANVFFRNQIRNRIIPLLEEVAPADVKANAAYSRDLLQEDDDALHAWLGSLISDLKGEVLDLSPLQKKPRALCRRAVQLWLKYHHVVLAPQVVIQILDTIQEGRSNKWSAGSERWLIYNQGQLSFEYPEIPLVGLPVKLAIGDAVTLSNGYTLSAAWVDIDTALLSRITQGCFSEEETVYLSAGSYDRFLSIRLWQPGDKYHPLGAPGSRKLQDCFIDKKIRNKHQRPVICLENNTILWCPGLPPANANKLVKPGRALRLTYQPS